MRRAALGASVLTGGIVLAAVWLHTPRPAGVDRTEADAAYDVMREALGGSAWDATGAVRWTFRGAHAHLWDRRRNLSRVRWGDMEVLHRLDRREGLAFRHGIALQGEEKSQALQDAWAYFANDSFWLAAPFKGRDPGTRRARAVVGGEAGVLVEYASGGVTPGDGYLWLRGQDGRPNAWRMWVSILPIGGLGVTWEGWQQLATGAWVSTRHRFGPLTLTLDDVVAAETVEALEGADPFAALVAASN